MRKILISGPSRKGEQGGQVTHLNNIEQSFDGDNCNIEFFTSSSAQEGESSLVKAWLLLFRFFYFPLCMFGKNTIHINTSLDDKALIRDFGLMFWAVCFRKPFILQIHGGLLSIANVTKVQGFLKVWCWFTRHAREIWVLTDKQAEEVSFLGINNITKVSNYIQMPEELSVYSTPFTFLFMGRILKEKGIYEILNALSAIKESGFEFKMVFCGSGTDLSELEQRIKSMHLSDVVTCVGEVSGLAKEHAFQRASVLLLPSYSEGLPYSVLEAMSYGVPTICTDVGALPDVVQHGVEGFLVEPKNVEKLSEAMEKLLSNPLLVKNMGEKSRDKMQASYSLDALNKKFKKAWFDASV